jgi:Putative prokaryotic signal transducing protein
MTANSGSLEIVTAQRLDALFAQGEHKGRARAVKPDRPVAIPARHHNRVKEILRTNDAVLLSWVEAVLADAGIDAVIFDAHTSILEGSISAIPRRLMVADDDQEAALRLLDAARGAQRDV